MEETVEFWLESWERVSSEGRSQLPEVDPKHTEVCLDRKPDLSMERENWDGTVLPSAGGPTSILISSNVISSPVQAHHICTPWTL